MNESKAIGSRPVGSVALVDTTLQLDRLKYRTRQEHVAEVLGGFEYCLMASLSIVEIKATLIQACVTIHNQMRQKGARFTQARDILLEKDHPQISLRAHIFNNLLNIHSPSSFEIMPEKDEELAERARLNLENIIPILFEWFSSDESVDSVLRDSLRCDRAKEAPEKKSAAFAATLPECRRGKNKTCRVEDLIREKGPEFVEHLRPRLGESAQLERSAEIIESVIRDSAKELSVGDCRRAGDCLIAIEAIDSATHALSTNRRDWEPVSSAAGFEYVHVTYPGEQTR